MWWQIRKSLLCPGHCEFEVRFVLHINYYVILIHVRLWHSYSALPLHPWKPKIIGSFLIYKWRSLVDPATAYWGKTPLSLSIFGVEVAWLVQFLLLMWIMNYNQDFPYILLLWKNSRNKLFLNLIEKKTTHTLHPNISKNESFWKVHYNHKGIDNLFSCQIRWK